MPSLRIVTAAAAVAATAGSALYLNAKYALEKDLRDLRRTRVVARKYMEASSSPTCVF
jgi:hypothetical protein